MKFGIQGDYKCARRIFVDYFLCVFKETLSKIIGCIFLRRKLLRVVTITAANLQPLLSEVIFQLPAMHRSLLSMFRMWNILHNDLVYF